MSLFSSARRLRAAASVLLLGLAAYLAAPGASAQTRDALPPFIFDPSYLSSRSFEKKALMDGNEVAITYFNYGLLGGVGEVRGNWPKGSDDFYVGDVLPLVAAEIPGVFNDDGTPVVHVVSTRGPGNRGINAEPGNASNAWTFEPKPGFASNRIIERTGEPNDRVALSIAPETWPDFWPDEPTWLAPDGSAQWNGFFGRDQFNADLETYFWADDNNDRELQTENGFRPDSLRPDRGGMGLELKVRGLQWSQFLAQDAIFWLYEVTNSSTTTYERVAVGLTVGTLSGGDGDSADDLAFFDQANRIVYSYDNDDSGNQGQDVGYVGYGFLESPGNPDNGIDDDGDGDPSTEAGRDVDGLPLVRANAGTDNTFQSGDFAPRVLAAGDPIITIDAETGARAIQYVPASGELTVVSQGRSYTVAAGGTLAETQVVVESAGGTSQTVTEKNLVDEDLDGVVDEDITLHFERRAQSFDEPPQIVTLPALKYKNYVGFANAIRGRTATAADSSTYGLLNPLIDEDRNNGIDEDGDWSASDDVGADGLAGTGDPGEGNGVPDPGEPNFDALDVTESDQVGLSSFYYFNPSGAFPVSADQEVWDGLTPGFFTTNEELAALQAEGGVDGDFVFGSGYFRLEPGETLRFTLALVFGEDLEDITNNQITIQEIYNRNYQFARPPDRPTLRAVPGDGQVTLYWDSKAEQSVDPILGDDFQGYRLFKSTDPFFRDAAQVSDVFGNGSIRVPEAQFDKDDGIQGIYTSTDARVRGVPFNLGSDTGLRYSFVDTDVDNGQRYYYAVTAYDSGSPDFFPAENDIPVSVQEDGTVATGTNVVEVTPNASAIGYVAGGLNGSVARAQGAATGDVFVRVLDPQSIVDGADYTIEFSDDPVAADSFFVLRNGFRLATGRIDDTVVRGAGAQAAVDGPVVVDGLQFAFRNETVRLDQDSTGFVVEDAALAGTRVGVINSEDIRFTGTAVPYDYEIDFDDALVGTSLGGETVGLPVFGGFVSQETQTNFTVRNTTLGRPAEFVFDERNSPTPNGRLDNRNELVYIYETVDGVRTPTFFFRLTSTPRGELTGAPPDGNDVFLIVTQKPFSARDVYAVSTVGSAIAEAPTDDLMERIRVVPNPYVAAASWERPPPPGVTGRGERRIDFTHLPVGARIRIFNVRGALVRELTHDGMIDDGTVSWDLRTRENLEAAYGVYFYHVEAPNGAVKTGRLALIK